MFGPDIDIGAVAMDLPDGTGGDNTILRQGSARGEKEMEEQKTQIRRPGNDDSHIASHCDPKGTPAAEKVQLIQVEYGK
jgi:hypothetical protein